MIENQENQNEVIDVLQHVNKDMLLDSLNSTQIEEVVTSEFTSKNMEKNTHLGYLDDQLLYEFTFHDLDEPDTYKRVLEKMKDINIGRAIISGDLPSEEIMKIIHIAKEVNLPFTVVEDPVFQGEIALGLIKKEES